MNEIKTNILEDMFDIYCLSDLFIFYPNISFQRFKKILGSVVNIQDQVYL